VWLLHSLELLSFDLFHKLSSKHQSGLKETRSLTPTISEFGRGRHRKDWKIGSKWVRFWCESRRSNYRRGRETRCYIQCSLNGSHHGRLGANIDNRCFASLRVCYLRLVFGFGLEPKCYLGWVVSWGLSWLAENLCFASNCNSQS